jgi:hypothetical protein
VLREKRSIDLSDDEGELAARIRRRRAELGALTASDRRHGGTRTAWQRPGL